MRLPFTRMAGAVALVATAWTTSGCGDPGLWARWRAERMSWHARRAVDRSDPRDPAAVARAGAALDRIVAAFPPSEWATPQSLERRFGADVARISGEAALRRAELARATGGAPAAADRYAEVARDYTALGDVAARACLAEAHARMDLGDEAGALAAWGRVLEREDWALRPEWSEAGTDAFRSLEASNRSAEADSLRAHGIARLDRALAQAKPGTGIESRRTLASWRAGAGDWPGGRATLRAALEGPASTSEREVLVLDLVEHSARAGQPDTASAYAAWAEREFRPAIGSQAVLIVATAWDRAGVADSALAVYKRVIDGAPMGSEPSLRARFERARILERRGAWEPARSELRTLASVEPAHELGLQALVAIVRHHRLQGETELAAIEGRHALVTVERLLAGYRDPAVRLRAGRTRGELLELLDRPEEAGRAYAELWAQFPGEAQGARAGLRAAEIADSALGDTSRSRELYQSVARDAADRAARDIARRRLEGDR